MSLGWSLPAGCAKLPAEEDDGFRACPKCRAEVGPPPNDKWRKVKNESGIRYEADYVCEECRHTFTSR